MLLSEIKPYTNNARNNEKAVSAVAESIKKFGFRGQILLISRDNPTIVNGHTRVKALQYLGCSELDDKHIAFADDLSEDEIKALRLADNKVAQIATWNRAKLRNEVNALSKKGIDMTKFNFNFKSKDKIYGAERLRTDDYYNLDIINDSHCDRNGMPKIKACNQVPKEILPFNYAKSCYDRDKWIHFFIDDYQFERLWNAPDNYIELLKSYDGVFAPDFSLYMDMPLPMQRFNEYRRRALSNYWQRCGIKVIPTLSWSDKRSYGFCFDGLPKRATYATSTVGVKSNKDALKVWFDGMNKALDVLHPKRILLYGGNIGYEFGEIELIEYKSNTAFRSS